MIDVMTVSFLSFRPRLLRPPGSKKMEHKGNSWHENCFTCNRCQQPIGTRSFVLKDANNYCLPCYEKQFAQQCVYCKKVEPREAFIYLCSSVSAKRD